MQIEWFVYHKNSVHGPFSTSDVNTQLAAGKFDKSSFIWWKGEKDWIAIEQWQNNYSQIVKRLESHYQSDWLLKIEDVATESMSFEQCLEHLKKVDLKKGVHIAKSSSPEKWENIFTNSIFMNALDMTRRKYPRVPVIATAKVSKVGCNFSYLVKLNVIGEGGIGVSGLAKNFPSNSHIDIRIEGPNFPAPIFAEGHIVYHTADGISGIEFKSLSAESRSAILDYVKRFESHKSASLKKSA